MAVRLACNRIEFLNCWPPDAGCKHNIFHGTHAHWRMSFRQSAVGWTNVLTEKLLSIPLFRFHVRTVNSFQGNGEKKADLTWRRNSTERGTKGRTTPRRPKRRLTLHDGVKSSQRCKLFFSRSSRFWGKSWISTQESNCLTFFFWILKLISQESNSNRSKKVCSQSYVSDHSPLSCS